VKKGIYLTLAFFFGVLCYGYYVHKTNDGLEFCQSCHVSPTKKLHGQIYLNFVATESQETDLAGYHRQNGEKFTCLSCHRGDTFEAKLLNDASAFFNLGKYLIGKFDSDKSLRFPIEDAICLDCHSLSQSSKKTKTFHGLVAHKYPFTVECLSCHSAHSEGKSNNFFINRAIALKICKKCHLNVTSEKFKTVISALKK